VIQTSIWSSLTFWYWFPGEVPPATDCAGELVAPRVGLLVRRSTSESGEGSRASFGQQKGCRRALPELSIRNRSNLGDWASHKTARTVTNRIVDATADRVVPLRVICLCRTTISPPARYEVELEIEGVLDPTQTSDVRLLIGVVGRTRICVNENAEVSFGPGLDAVFGCVAGLIVVFDFLAGRGRAFLGVVVALPSHSPLYAWDESLHFTDIIIIQLRLWCKSQEISRVISRQLANGGKLLFVRSMSVDVRDSMSETQCQSRIY